MTPIISFVVVVGSVDFVIGAIAAAGFLRVVVGPITQVQLTHASSVRFEQWLTEEDTKDDTENNDA